MTIEEAIKKIEYGLEMETTEKTPFGQLTVVSTDAMKMALSAIKSNDTQKTNDPLTLKELRQMAGEPVWCKEMQRYGIVKVETCGMWANRPFMVGVFHDKENGTALNFEYDIKNGN